MVSIGAATDVGMVRRANQDCYGVSENFAVVADGMGGHNCGDTASKLAVDAITEVLNLSGTLNFKAIGAAIEKANSKILKLSKEQPEMNGMGTTVVILAWDKTNAYIANVGDSRCYKIKGNEILQLTKDHSLVQKLLDNGDISPEEAALRRDKNVLYRAVGCDDVPQPDYFELQTESGDAFLLCSDGLTNCVSDKDILKVITKSNDMQKASEKLIELANKNGGSDNITALIIKFI